MSADAGGNARFPSPVVGEAPAVPRAHGFRLHDHEVVGPISEQASDENPEYSVAVLEPGALHAALEYDELRPKHDVLEREALAIRTEGDDQIHELSDELHGRQSTAHAC